MYMNSNQKQQNVKKITLATERFCWNRSKTIFHIWYVCLAHEATLKNARKIICMIRCSAAQVLDSIVFFPPVFSAEIVSFNLFYTSFLFHFIIFCCFCLHDCCHSKFMNYENKYECVLCMNSLSLTKYRTHDRKMILAFRSVFLYTHRIFVHLMQLRAIFTCFVRCVADG